MNFFKKTYLFITLLLFSTATLSAQSIHGKVFDEETGKPMAYAAVSLGHGGPSTFTNLKGAFELVWEDRHQEEKVHLHIKHLGFEPMVVEVHLPQEEELWVALKEKPIHVEEILVEGKVLRRTAQSEVMGSLTNQLPRPENVSRIFTGIAGFDLVKRGAYSVDPVFRSFRYEQLNIQYDGGVQIFHACPNRMDPITTHVMPEEVEKVEVIRGPFSVRYGQTMGGIMNIITEEPAQYEEFHLGGRLETGYESNGNGKYTHASLLAADEQYDLLFSGGIRDYGSYQDGYGRDVYSGFQTYDYALKGGWRLPNHQRLQINWRHSFGNDILHAGLPMDTEEENSQILSLDYVIQNLGPHLYSLTAKVFFSEVYHDMNNFRRPNFEKVEAESVVEAVTAGGKAELAFIPSARWLIYTGLDFRSLQRTGERERLVKVNPMTGEPLPNPVLHRDAIWQDAIIDNAGYFMEARWYPSDRISVSTGLRLDFVTATLNEPTVDFAEAYGVIEREDNWMHSGNATVTWEFVENWDVQLSLGRGVRMPNMEERYINHFAIRSDGFEYVGDPHLEPEINHQVELSLEKEGGRFHFLATVFYSHIENFITAAIDSTLPWKYSSPDAPAFAKRFQNVHSASQFGLELSASYELLPHFYFYGMVAHVDAENHDWHEPLPQIPPLTTVLGMRYDNGRWVANLKGRIVAAQEHIAPSFGETVTPGFETMDIAVEYRWEKLQLGVAVENVFDRKYYQHLNWSYRNLTDSGILHEPGRNLSVFARYVFD